VVLSYALQQLNLFVSIDITESPTSHNKTYLLYEICVPYRKEGHDVMQRSLRFMGYDGGGGGLCDSFLVFCSKCFYPVHVKAGSFTIPRLSHWSGLRKVLGSVPTVFTNQYVSHLKVGIKRTLKPRVH